MQIREQIIPYQLLYPITDKYVKEEMVFFDIETTGFSPELSYVYLIGCAYYCDNTFKLIQWFSEGVNQERELIIHFFEFIKPYRLLIHYNGTGFDIPFLNQKIISYQLPYNFEHIDSFDIYKKIIPYKKRLPLPDLKLKTLEQFFKLKRKDPYSGGDLIDIYIKYLAFHTLELKNVEVSSLRPSKQSGLRVLGPGNAKVYLDALLLHNAEDVMNLLIVISILSYVDLFQGKGCITSLVLKDTMLVVQLELPFALPISICDSKELICQSATFQLLIEAVHKTAIFKIPVVASDLKFFFENYKDYYYLPCEDTAVHKSVGEYVDKAFRCNAKANNCYIKKTGVFLPQKACYKTPAFRFEYKDKLTWFELSDDFLVDQDQQLKYVQNLLNNM
jgi:uncharacterized protein YprB with RNaseH-like and TPR domain